MGKVNFLPQTNKARQFKLMWSKIVWYKCGGKVNTAYIRRKACKCGRVSPLSCTLQEVERAKKISINRYEALKPKATKLQKEFLWDKANDHLEQSDEGTRKQAKCLLHEEVQRDAVRHLRRVLGTTGNSRVDWIEVKEDGEMIRYDDQENIEKKIMESNKKQFCLTETSPPMQEPLVIELGYLTNTKTAEQILQGTYICPPGVDMHTQQFLASLHFTTPITNENWIPMSVMKEDY
jgi:hypothetical protein